AAAASPSARAFPARSWLQDYDPTARDGSLALRGHALAPCRAVWQGSPHARPLSHPSFSHPARRCRSSVVEHPLGKGEVVSSILTGSTRYAHDAVRGSTYSELFRIRGLASVAASM